jgi:hypothetical protein
MSYSFTATETKTFTLTHAQAPRCKVAADLKRLQRLYGHITDERIAEFEGEATELLRQGYLGTVTYGFQRDDKWIEPTLAVHGERTGRTAVRTMILGACAQAKTSAARSFHSYLTYSAAWWALTPISVRPSRSSCRCSVWPGSEPLSATATSPTTRPIHPAAARLAAPA